MISLQFFKTEKEYKEYVDESCNDITDKPETYPCVGLEHAYYDESTGFEFIYKIDAERMLNFLNT